MNPPRARVDVVAVLGAQVLPSGMPGPAIRRRVSHGARVFVERSAGHLLLSGGGGPGTPPEAVLMRELALAEGVPADRILVEDRSSNTFENALFSGQIIRRNGWRSIVVVTDGFHLRRALFVFRRLGMAVEGEGVPRPPDVSRLYWCVAHADELVRFVRSASLFAVGAHKAVVEAARRR